MVVADAMTRPQAPAWSHLRAGAAALGLAVAGMTPFFLVGRSVDPALAYRLRTPLDDAIPFVPWTVWIYSLVYTSVLLPAFVVRCPRLYRRTLAAFAAVLGLSIAIYAAFPVTAVGFRPEPHTLDTSTFLGWGTWLTFTVDPPVNLFPSMHMAAAVLAALAAWTARPLYGALGGLYALGIAVTICTMKQHYVADGVAAILLALGVWAIATRGYEEEAPPPGERASGLGGPLAYLGLQVAFYAVFYAVWRAWFAAG